MIEKILSIQNVGKFMDYSCSGDVAFRTLTLIFGENGRGKSTLSAIFRSLCTGEARYLKERRTLGTDDEPVVKLRLDDSNAEFVGGAWDRTLPAMELFDPVFVHENVYAGDAIEHEHKKNLHLFAIGKEGVQIAKRIVQMDNNIRKINPKFTETRLQLEKHIVGAMDVSTFIALGRNIDVEKEIDAKTKEIESIKKSDVIANKPLLAELVLPELPFLAVEELLSKGIEDISVDAERMVKDHISRCMDEQGERWIGQGMQYIKDERCPFCNEDIQGVKVVENYRSYFSERYAELKKEIARMSESIKNILSHNSTLSLQQSIQSNKTLVEFWEEYIKSDFPCISFDDIKMLCDDAFRHLNEHLEKKSTSPLESLIPSDGLRKVMQEYNHHRTVIEAYNQSVKKVNLIILAKKKELRDSDLSVVERELERFENVKVRFSLVASGLCDYYQQLQNEKMAFEQEKDNAKEQLKDYTADVLVKYEGRINDYLEKYGADFRIVEISEQHYGGKPSVNYRISINDVAVDLEAEDASESTPCFKNTLSSGDKSTLAIAFFLARLDLDSSLKDKVVIIDDPISSLDSYRRTFTQQQITRVSELAKQVILLSHDPYFLQLTWKNSKRSDTKTLRITRAGRDSIISEWDIERETQDEYSQNYFTLAKYLEEGPSGNLHDVARCIRPLLEGNLRVRFPGQFPSGKWLGEMLNSIREANEGGPLYPLKPTLPELSDINGYSKNFHHDQNPSADSHPVTDVELTAYVRRTLRILSGV